MLAWMLGVAMVLGAPAGDERVQVELMRSSGEGGVVTSFDLAVRLRMVEPWHTYWVNPGDSGMPTRIRLELPEGFVAGEPEWPVPKVFDGGGVLGYGYSGEVVVFVPISAPEGYVGAFPDISARISWLACDATCVPGSAEVTEVVESHDLAAHRALLPRLLTDATVTASVQDKVIEASIAGLPGELRERELLILVEEESVVVNAATQEHHWSGDSLRVRLPVSPYAAAVPEELTLLLAAQPREREARLPAYRIKVRLSEPSG